ncbi:hypothetical protein N8843_09220, partial [Verrucomicrobia bacterium]|nr:hypothetical protein [Verrucomicrobiota bacterium]
MHPISRLASALPFRLTAAFIDVDTTSFCYLKFLFARMSIATYIKEDLAAQMKSGQALNVPLTLVSLAEHYHVSLTPVRKA